MAFTDYYGSTRPWARTAPTWSRSSANTGYTAILPSSATR